MRDPFEVLQAARDQLVARLPDLGSPIPDRVYVSGGNAVAFDTEQLTVNLNRITGGRPGAEDQIQFNVFQVFFAEVQITLLRKAPMAALTGRAVKLPATTDEETSAGSQVMDMKNVTQVLADISKDGSLTGGTPGIPVTIGPTVPYGPSGGLVGTLAVVSVQLV